MAALLRSGKFLRLVTGIARQSQTPSGATQINQNSTNQTDASPLRSQEANVSFQPWSLRHLHAALSALGSASQDKQDEEGLFKLTDLDLEAKILGEPKENKTKEEKQKTIRLKKPFKSGVIGFDAIKEEEDTIEMSQVAQKAVINASLHKFKGSSTTVRPKDQKKFRNEKLEAIQVPNDKLQLPLQEIVVSDVETPERNAEEAQVEVEDGTLAKVQQTAGAEFLTTPSDEYYLPASAFIPMVQIRENGGSQVLPLHAACAMFRDQGRVTDLENLLIGSYGICREDRKLVFMWTLQAYADQGMFNGAIMLSKRLEWEGLSQDFPEFHLLFGQLIQNTVLLYPPTLEISLSTLTSPYPTCPSTPVSLNTEDDGSYVQTVWYRKLKKALQREHCGEVMKAVTELEKINKVASVNELSAVVELLVKNDYFSDAISVTEAMLTRRTYPTPKIFRFLLNRLAATGQVELMNKLNLLMSTEARKEVSFDNRLCNAYLAAGLGREYLENMEHELDELDPQNFETELNRLKDKFPRGGAMGILETDPSVVCSFTRIAEKFLKYGFVAPTNVLWTYHFISGNYDLAETLWNKHVKDCPQIMFQKVCQTARLTGNADLAWRLVGLLRNASVTRGARGIAYSCLIDVLALKGDHEQGCEALRQALADGIHVSDVNRTALKRLGDCCTQNGVIFPFEVPQRTNAFFAASHTEMVTDFFSSAMVADG